MKNGLIVKEFAEPDAVAVLKVTVTLDANGLVVSTRTENMEGADRHAAGAVAFRMGLQVGRAVVQMRKRRGLP